MPHWNSLKCNGFFVPLLVFSSACWLWYLISMVVSPLKSSLSKILTFTDIFFKDIDLHLAENYCSHVKRRLYQHYSFLCSWSFAIFLWIMRLYFYITSIQSSPETDSYNSELDHILCNFIDKPKKKAIDNSKKVFERL